VAIICGKLVAFWEYLYVKNAILGVFSMYFWKKI